MCEVVIYYNVNNFFEYYFLHSIKKSEKKLPISTDAFPKIAYLPDVRALCDATLWRDSITSTFQAQVELDGVVVVHAGCEEVSLWDLMRILTFSLYEHI